MWHPEAIGCLVCAAWLLVMGSAQCLFWAWFSGLWINLGWVYWSNVVFNTMSKATCPAQPHEPADSYAAADQPASARSIATEPAELPAAASLLLSGEINVSPRISHRLALGHLLRRLVSKAGRRLFGFAVVLVAGCCALTACASDPTTPSPASLPASSSGSASPSTIPSPLPSSVSLDDPEIAELFHQAERAFTAYVEAENNLDYRDMNTVQKLYETTGEPQRSFYRELEEDRVREGVHFVGNTRIISMTPLGLDEHMQAMLHICLDISGGELRAESGTPYSEGENPGRISREVTFVPAHDSQAGNLRYLVSGIRGYQGEIPCT